MRDAFMAELLLAARRDPRIMLVVGDLGFGVVDTIANELPQQFLNAGVAEQNMLGMAAGLATCGYTVFVYSIANFPTLRAVEQIRNDVCYHNLDVKVVSVGAGVSYGTLGYTHHAVEDLAILRTFPHMRVLCPADPYEAQTAVHECLANRGPAYVRLGKNGEPVLHGSRPGTLTRPIALREGTDVVLAGVGAVVAECLAAADLLAAEGVSAEVVSCPTVKPFDTAWVGDARESRLIVTVEEHTLHGGFGSVILEAANLLSAKVPVLRLGMREDRLSDIGSGRYLRSRHGLDGSAIACAVQRRLTSH